MHIRIHRYDPQKEEKPVLPSSKNFRKQDLVFFRVIIIMLAIAFLYCVPYMLVVMNNPHEKNGILQDVQEVRSGVKYRTTVGLDLLIDGEEYYLPGRYIKWDEYYLSGKQIEGKSTDELWKIRNLEHKLKRTIGQPITIQYLEYKNYQNIDNLTIVEAASVENEWINIDYAFSVRKALIRGDAIVFSSFILLFAALYFFRKNYILEIKRNQKASP